MRARAARRGLAAPTAARPRSVAENHGRLLPKLGLVLVLLAAAAAGLYFGLQRTARVKPANRDVAVDAVTGSVHVDADGGIRQLKSEIGGKVKAVYIGDRDRFKEGDVLVELDTTDLDEQIKKARREREAAVKRAELAKKASTVREDTQEKYEDARREFERGAISADQMRAAERALTALDHADEVEKFNEEQAKLAFEAHMAELTRQRDKMFIRAPYDGAVDLVLIKPNELIGGGHVVAQIYSNARVVAAKVSEEDFGKVKIGQRATVRLLTYGNQQFEATVKALHPVADDAQRFTVFLDVKADPELLKPNSTGEVTITVDRREDQVVIPKRALINGQEVFVVKNGVVERRRVEVGFDSAFNVVEITKGLEPGEHVIVDHLDLFRPGQRVREEIVN